MNYDVEVYAVALESIEGELDEDPVCAAEWLRLERTLLAWLYRPN